MQEQGGSTDRQTARLASGNIPYRGCHAHFVNGGWLGGLDCLPTGLVSVSLNPLLPRSSVFFRSFAKFTKLASSGFRDCCLEAGCELVIGW